jgi:hypothetical protein
VALALTPLALLFVLAGSAGRTLFWTMFVMLGALGHWTVYRALHAVESGGRPSAFLPAAPLFFAWSVLTGMVGLALVASYRAVIP